MVYNNAIYTVISAFSLVAISVPFAWHLEAWNVGTCLFMFWTFLGLLVGFVNSIVWSDNAINVAPIWCDISVKVILGVAVGIPAASLCINRRLYQISSVNSVRISGAEKRRAMAVDLLIGLGIPVLQMIVSYVSQGQRYMIYERIGCLPATYLTPVAFVLILSWPVAIGLVSAVYCILSIRAFHKRQVQFKELLSMHSNLNSNRYVRLMCLAGIEILLTVPLGSYFMYLSASVGMAPWISWANTHEDFGRIDRYPHSMWSKFPGNTLNVELTRWSLVLCAVVFFAFFGFADEAQRHYRLAYASVAKKVGYTSTSGSSSGFTSSNGKSSSKSGTLPVFIRQTTTRKRDSLLSFEYDKDKRSLSEKRGSHTLSIPEFALDGGADKDYSPFESTEFTSTTSSQNRWSVIDSYARPLSMVPPSVIARPAPALDLASFAKLDLSLASRRGGDAAGAGAAAPDVPDSVPSSPTVFYSSRPKSVA